MTELHDDLRATADSIAADAERLAQIEKEKESLADRDSDLEDLSGEAQRIARELVAKTTAELELAKEAGSA